MTLWAQVRGSTTDELCRECQQRSHAKTLTGGTTRNLLSFNESFTIFADVVNSGGGLVFALRGVGLICWSP